MRRHLPMPDYAVELLRKQMCFECGAPCFKRDQVTHVGICFYKDRHVFFYAVTCPRCDSPMNILVTSRGEMTVEQLAEDMGGQVPQPIDGVIPPEDEAQPQESDGEQKADNPITDEEVAQLLAELDKAKSDKDVLRAIGLRESEIEKHRRKEDQ